MEIFKLKNTIQDYAWGSETLIPEHLGIINADQTPMAEIWMGAHPKAPSALLTEKGEYPLSEAIAHEPERFLGPVSAKYDKRLPFLFKVLAAGTPLSIQSHPNLEQARTGYRRENEQGIPVNAPNRNYRDDNHKPEIICALTPFWALRGFRPLAEIRNNFARGLEPFDLSLPESDGGKPQLSAFFSALMECGETTQQAIVESVLQARTDLHSDADEWMRRLQRQYPGDIGVLCPLLLNLVQLKSGEAMYLPAGELHAYLSGLGMELMANSDNVLRGGLTPKHIDVPELLSTLTFSMERPEILHADSSAQSGRRIYRTPIREFVLSEIRPQPDVPSLSGPRVSLDILFATEGMVTLNAGTETVRLNRGESAVIAYAAGEYECSGNGTVYCASLPDQS